MTKSRRKYSADKCVELLEDARHLDWYHKFEVELGSGIMTPGRLDTKGYAWRRGFANLNKEFLKGKRVLDIGAYSGAFSFLLEDLGADEVVAADVYDPKLNGFDVVHDIRQSNVKHVRMSVYDLDPRELGTFDIVAFYGVFYHLKHPMLALERCNSVLKLGGLFLGGGTGLDGWFHDNDPSCTKGVNLEAIRSQDLVNQSAMSVESINELNLCGFAPGQFFRDKTNWFIPNLACLLSWVTASGFEVTGSHKNTMPIDRSWNLGDHVKRTSLNFKAVKTSEPSLEYTIPAMQQFRIPTQYEVDCLKARVTELEALLKKK